MSATFFVNGDVVMLLHEGEMMRVDTNQISTASLVQAASDLLCVAAGRLRREAWNEQSSKDRPDADRGDLRPPGLGGGG